MKSKSENSKLLKSIISICLGLIMVCSPLLINAQSRVPCSDKYPDTDDYSNNQLYLENALDVVDGLPNGIDARYAWIFPGGRGLGVKVVDIEGYWNVNHEDLPDLFLQSGYNRFNPGETDNDKKISQDHGTHGLGIVGACNNGFGVTGIASDARIGYSAVSPDETHGDTPRNRAAAIDRACEDLSFGDVIWIPLQTNSKLVPSLTNPSPCDLERPGDMAQDRDKVPSEWEDAVFDAIKRATDKGIIVVEAAGNRGVNLDSSRYGRKFDRSFRDSGAILVGAGQSPMATDDCLGNPRTPRAPIPFSNYGSRLDVQGWGEWIFSPGRAGASTTGPDLSDVDQLYGNFGGTSGASPMVAGAIACIQGIVKAQGRPPLSPLDMRDLLVATGTPQRQADMTGDGIADPRHIGPLPNLHAAITALHQTSLAAGYFNNDSFQDLAIGIPWAEVNRVKGAGKVIVLMGSETGLSVLSPIVFTQDTADVLGTAQTGDFFGYSLAAGDYDGNGRDDLAIGIPFQNVGTVVDAGEVAVIYSDTGGLNPRLTQNLFTSGESEPGDHFGFSLAAGDFDGNGRDDLAIGAPDEDIEDSNAVDGGAVKVIYSDANGLGVKSQIYDQSHPAEVPGTAETRDRFGFSLAAGNFDGDANGRDDLAIGVPFEMVDGKPQAGAVNIIYSRTGGLDPTFKTSNLRNIHQNVDGIPSEAEPGDLFGYALAVGDFDNNSREDLAIGVPGEDVFAEIDAGVVNVIYSDAAGLNTGFLVQEFHQSMVDIPGRAEAGDRFGAALAAGDFDNSRPNHTLDDLAIGSPGEDVSAMVDAGAVVVVYSQGSNGLSPAYRTNLFDEDEPAEVPSAAGSAEHFGAALAAGRFNSGNTEDLAIAVWGEPFASGRPTFGYTSVIYSAGLSGLDGTNSAVYWGLL